MAQLPRIIARKRHLHLAGLVRGRILGARFGLPVIMNCFKELISLFTALVDKWRELNDSVDRDRHIRCAFPRESHEVRVY